MLKPRKNELRKPTRTLSGIAPVAVMLPLRKCEHGMCIYCPNLDVPQSYTPKSPVVMRASKVNYDSFKQVKARIKAFESMHHPTEKIELIIMGGTFLQYPEKFQYEFIKGCYDGLNGKKSESFEEAKKLNEKARHRCVALCVETRPDACSEKDIQKMRKWGVTRVELGVQILDDEIYKKIKRGHKVKDVVKATRLLKNAGFKVGYHVMPGLPGSNFKKDLQLFKKIFSDEKFKPDQLKIYPCQVMPGSVLENWYWKEKYKPYSEEKIKKILIEMMKIVPCYCRVMRVMREIPPEYIVAGTKRIDLRKDVEEELRKEKAKIKEIRFREIGFNLFQQSLAFPTTTDYAHSRSQIDNIINPKKSRATLERANSREKFDNLITSEVGSRGNLKLKTTKYKASEGEEYFLEIINSENVLFGLLRLRIFSGVNSELPAHSHSQINKMLMKKQSGQPETFQQKSSDLSLRSKSIRANESEQDKSKEAIIRELHVYGRALEIGKKGEVQHTGLGKWLMNEAEKIVKKQGIKKLKVISGVGVREYYRNLGYRLDNAKGNYMIKTVK